MPEWPPRPRKLTAQETTETVTNRVLRGAVLLEVNIHGRTMITPDPNSPRFHTYDPADRPSEAEHKARLARIHAFQEKRSQKKGS